VVVPATHIAPASKSIKEAGRKVSAVIFVGHGHADAVGLQTGKVNGHISPVNARGRFDEQYRLTLAELANRAGIEKGGLVGVLSCGNVTGRTASETQLTKRGITTVGYNRKVDFKDYTHKQTGAVHYRFGPVGGTLTSPGKARPLVQSGPDRNKKANLQQLMRAAEGRVNSPVKKK
jgi:hypothetical protein